MNVFDASIIVNVLLIVALIIDRIFRLAAIKEFKEAKNEIIKSKEAHIDLLRQHLEMERKTNDIEIAEMHKKRYENLKLILEEKETTLNKNQQALLELKADLDAALKEVGMKQKVSERLLTELNSIAKAKHDVEVEKKTLQELIDVLGLSPLVNKSFVPRTGANKYIF